MADDANGVIYRVAYQGRAKPAAPLQAPADEMKRQAAQGIGVPLAKDRPETAAASGAAIQITSPSFAAGQAIPPKHSEYVDGVSPKLSWSAVANAKSYVLLAAVARSGMVESSRQLDAHWNGFARRNLALAGMVAQWE